MSFANYRTVLRIIIIIIIIPGRYLYHRSLREFIRFICWITAHKRPSTLRPSHMTWAVSPPVGSYRLQPPSPFIIITQPASWYSFTVPRRVEGWVDLGTAGRVHTARAQGCKSQWLCDKHNCPQRDSIVEVVTHTMSRMSRISHNVTWSAASK